MELGLLPALGSGIGDLERSGQASRLIDGYLRRYARAFDRVWYASYLPEALSDFTGDAGLSASVRILAPRGRSPRLLRAVSITASHRRELRRCAVFRVFQATGAIPALAARAWWGTPFVTTYGFWYAELSRGAASRLAKRALERVALRSAAAVIAPTEPLRAHVAALARADRIHLIPNGVDLDRFRPATSPKARRECVVYLGRLSEEKNLSTLVQAVAALRGRAPCRLVMIGAGPMRSRLEAEARMAGVVAEFPGVVDNRVVPEWLRRADAFVLSSFTEGHPKALLEAMASGLPCIVSDCPGNRALVTDGATGLLFDPRDPLALAAQLERVLRDEPLAAALGRAARGCVAAAYDLDRLVGAEIELLEQVARGTASMDPREAQRAATARGRGNGDH
jgi:glycosyltransferase involved in cell wall biosynthesis